jgi:membrane protease YdiL (CAAX protease family)
MEPQPIPERWPALISDRAIIFLGLAFMFLPELIVVLLTVVGIIQSPTVPGDPFTGISDAAFIALKNLAVLEIMIRVKQRSDIPNHAIGTLMPSSPRWFLSAIVAYFALNLLTNLLARLMQSPQSEELKDVSRSLLSHDSNFLALTITFLAIVVITPIVEEILFRGFIYGWLRQRFSMDVAIVISSLAFAIAHFQYLGLDSQSLMMAMFYLCGLGFFAARLREKSGSIYPPIVLHSFSNLIVFWNLY